MKATCKAIDIKAVSAELDTFEIQRVDGALKGDFTAREIALVAEMDAWAAQQAPVVDPLADTAAIFGVE